MSKVWVIETFFLIFFFSIGHFRSPLDDAFDRSTYKEDVILVEQSMSYLAVPEEAHNCLQQLTRMAKFPRKRMLIVKAGPFDTIFEFMESGM